MLRDLLEEVKNVAQSHNGAMLILELGGIASSIDIEDGDHLTSPGVRGVALLINFEDGHLLGTEVALDDDLLTNLEAHVLSFVFTWCR